MIYNLLASGKEKIAIEDDNGRAITFGELVSFSDEVAQSIPQRSLVFILAQNNVETLSFYIACINNKIVPLILGNATDKELLNELLEKYQPNFLWMPKSGSSVSQKAEFDKAFCYGDYHLFHNSHREIDLNPELSLLLSTSGSTGSPKLVRHSYRNIEASAENVSEAFKIQDVDCTLLPLPLQYTMGLSVASSHLYSGATVILSQKPLTDPIFWKLVKDERVTSITGVPYTYEILDKLRFFRRDIPNLKLISQGGGKLSNDLFKKIASYCLEHGKHFVATYGQTEGTARMAYLKPELALHKQGSIGFAIPNGELFLEDQNKQVILSNDKEGEMCYKGENVTLGYAESLSDLAKGDENFGVLRTGDLATRDSDGCYFITGRKKRFLKIFGIRIGLDQVEHIIKSNFDTDCVCVGDDSQLEIYITNEGYKDQVSQLISKKIGLYHKAIKVMYKSEILRNHSGKVIFDNKK